MQAHGAQSVPGVQMTARKMPFAHVPELRLDPGADIHSVPATALKAAARGNVDGARNFPGQYNPVPAQFRVRYRYGASVDDAMEKLNYDLFYIKNMSIFMDIVIILKTVKIVLFGKGAR